MALGGSIAGVAKAVLTADTSQFDRGMAEAQGRFHRNVDVIEHDADRMGRGILAGSGAFSHLGRSIAFASGAFLGGAGFTAVVRSSIEAAEGLEKAHRQLDAQIRAGGESVKQAQPGIEELDRSMARFGHTSTETETALARLVRATGDVADGEKLMGLAADLAAARHISFAQAALLVGKVFDGNVSALNRYGIRIEKGTSVTDALRIAQEKLAGQAAAGVTPMERLHATVGNLQATLGTQLLPTLNHIATGLSNWLGDTKNQERVQRDFKETLDILASTVRAVAAVFKTVTGAVGGTRNALELLGVTALAWKTRGAVNAVAGLTMVGNAAEVSTGKVAGLRGALTGLSRMAAIVVPIEILIHRKFISQEFSKIPGYNDVARWVDKNIPGFGALDRLMGTGPPPAAGSQPGGPPTGAAPQTGSRPQRDQGAAIVAVARTQIGIAYQWGGPAILGQHTDCSGLAQAVLAKNGINIGRTTYVQWTQGRAVNPGDLQAGDLVFFHMGKRGPEHVGIYIGNDQFIEDPHTGASVRVSKLSTYGGFVGARRYITDTASTATAGTGFQHNPDKPAAPGAFEPIPKDLRLAYAAAAVTKSNADDLRVLRQIDDYLKERLKVEKNKNNRIALLEAEKSTLDQIASLTKKKDPKQADLIPAGLRLELAEAQVTKSNADDLRVLRKIDDYLRDRLKHTTDINKRIEILNAISGNQGQIAALTPTPKTPPLLPVNLQEAINRAGTTRGGRDDLRALDNAISFVERRIGQAGIGEKSKAKLEKLLRQLVEQRNKIAAPIRIAGLTRSLPRLPSITGVTTAISNLQGGQGTRVVNVPGIGKILTAFSLTPTIGAWNKILGQLKKKYKATHLRLVALRRSLAKAEKARFRNEGILAWLRSQIAGVQKVLGEIKADIATAIGEIAQLKKDAADKAQKDADEADTAAEAGAADIPVSIQQALADAELAGDVPGQVAALTREAEFLQGELSSGTVVTAGGRVIDLTPEARVQVTTALSGVQGQIASLTTPPPTDTATAGVADTGTTDIGTTDIGGTTAPVAATDPLEMPIDLQQRFADANVSGDPMAMATPLAIEDNWLTGLINGGGLTADQMVQATNMLADVRRQERELQPAAPEAAAPPDPNQIPADLRLAVVRAQGTPGTADDLVALRGERGFIQGRIAATTDPELLITLTDSLNGINSQIDDMIKNQETQIDQQAQFQEFFTGLRGLRGFESNILGSALSGSLIQVINYFARGPEDQHTFSAGVAFELRALVG